jgi:choline dehydrogenase-like flavoprotein
MATQTETSPGATSEPADAEKDAPVLLSKPIESLPGFDSIDDPIADIDILIIGSGYGGSVAVARLAGARDADGTPLRVVLFERGREIAPGAFPDSFAQLPGEVRLMRHDNDELIGNGDALFDIRSGKTVNVLLGNGLGGGSLINAAVVEAPHESVWQDPHWPKPLREPGAVQPWLDKARTSLATSRIDSAKAPGRTKTGLSKLVAMQALDQQIDPQKTRYRTVDVAIDDKACTRCGDCMTGCNLNAKNTLPKTYLATAHANGAEIYTGVSVSHIEAAEGFGWKVHFVLTGSKGHRGLQTQWVVRARHVILAAGSLGSTEILQRSQHVAKESTQATDAAQSAADGVATRLRFSSRLGMQFSCNGDMIWGGYGQRAVVNGLADPAQPLNARSVGPTICSMIDLRDQNPPHVIQDASVPGAMKRLFEEVITTAAVSYRMIKRDTEVRRGHQDVDALDPDKLARTCVYLSMGRDQALGTLNFLPDTPAQNTGLTGRIKVQWGKELEGPGTSQTDNVGLDPVYAAAEASLQAVVALGGTLIPNPLWRAAPSALLDQLSEPKQLKSTITVHPLGGCAMADDIRTGVVNHYGAVFDLLGAGLDAVHAGLYVLDGAIIPTSIGINPLLTITALAERAVAGIAEKEKWALHQDEVTPHADWGRSLEPTHIPSVPESSPFTFQETMTWSAKEDQIQEKEGATHTALPPADSALAEVEKMTLEVNFEIGKENLASFLQNPQRRVAINNAWLRIKPQHTNPANTTPDDDYKLSGSVGWLIETVQTDDAKEKEGLYRYLVSRAAADIENMPDVPRWGKWLLRKAIDLIRCFDIHLPTWLTRLLGRFSERLKNIFALASHTGGQRLLTYELKSLDAGWELKGQKVINYGNGSNLWRSISDMDIAISRYGKAVATLPFALNWHDIFEDNVMQLAAPSTGAPRNPDLWLDLASVMALWLRSVMRIHFWSFRLPEVQQAKRRRKLPQARDSTWYPLSLPDWQGRTVALGVTHFPASVPASGAETASGLPTGLPPLLLIHGFGASGLQFSAPDMATTMVRHLQDTGRDVWVAELRTSIVMNQDLPDKHAQWSMDEVAMNDIPALIRFVIEKSNQSDPARAKVTQVDVLAHCIGSAMFNIALLSGSLQQAPGAMAEAASTAPPSLVRRAALLQVGPIFTVSRGNKLRAYMAYFMGGGLQRDFVDSSTDAQSQDWKDALMDRVLNTYPLPQHEITSGNPAKSVMPVFPGNQWLANYFRSTGVFGRLFNIDQLSQAMLNNIGDLLGRTNFKTFRQILQSIMHNHLVDAEGRNVYVSADNMRQHYSFPLRFFYGSRNDVFSEKGITESLRRLRAAHGWEASDAHEDASHFSWQSLEGFGHLDPLIGERAADKVFPQLSTWLNQAGEASQGQLAPGWTLREPDYGPQIGWTRKEGGKWWARAWLHARETAGLPVYAAAFRLRKGQIVPDSLRLFLVHVCPLFKMAVFDLPLDDDGTAEYGVAIVHRDDVASTGAKPIPLAWSSGPGPGIAPHLQIPTAPAVARGARRVSAPGDAIAHEVGAYQAQQQSAEAQLEQEILAIQAIQVNQADQPLRKLWKYRTIKPLPAAVAAPSSVLRIALGSCRYSGTMIEQVRNNAPYEKLLAAIDAGQFVPAFMLLMGDQIYLDATAGVVDSSELHAGISLYHRSLARMAAGKPLAAAKVFCRMPAYMMLDDHEISDNWCGADDAGTDSASRNAQERTRMAVSAFTAFQWAHCPRNPLWSGANIAAPAPRHYWYHFSHAEVAVFVLDTRLERTPPLPAPGAQIISAVQFEALSAWLTKTSTGNRLRLIVSPSQIADPAEDHALKSDSWAAYPADLQRLSDELWDQENVAIVCGDLHAHGLFQLECHRGSGVPVKRIPVIVASPLYAPYPFANQGSKIRKNRKLIRLSGAGLALRILALDQQYQGFVQLRLERSGTQWHGALYQADGQTPLLNLPDGVNSFPI